MGAAASVFCSYSTSFFGSREIDLFFLYKRVKQIRSDQKGLMKHILVSSAARSDFFPFVSAVLKLFPICKDPKIALQLSVPAGIRPHDSVRSACGMQRQALSL